MVEKWLKWWLGRCFGSDSGLGLYVNNVDDD